MKWIWIAITLTALTTSAAAQEYAVQLLRPQKVGTKCTYTGQAKVQEIVTLTKEGQVINRSMESFSVDMKAEREILEVDAQGRVLAANFKVVYCMRTRENKMKELAPRGALIEARFKDGEETFSIDGQPASPETAEALSIMVVLADGGPTFDQVFGTSAKQAAGSSWPVNRAAAAESFKASGVTVKPDDVSGTISLKGKGNSGNRDYLEFEGGMTFEKLSVGLPDTYTLLDGRLTYRFNGRFPLDTSLEPLQEKKEMMLAINARDKSDPKIVLNSVTKQTANVKKIPL